MITPYAPKRDIVPYRPSVLDIETAANGDCIGLGFGWEDSTGAIHYERFDGWEDWLAEFRAIYKASDRPTRLRLRRIYAHNGGSFDWLHFLRFLIDTEKITETKTYMSGSRFAAIDLKLRVAGERFTLRLRDSIMLMPGSLKVIAQTFGVENQKIDLGDELPEATKARDESLFWEYLRLDVRALQDSLKRFWELIYERVGSIDELPMTLPGLAMRLFRMGLTKPIPVPWNRKLKELERAAYVGGRTEAIEPGEYPEVAVYDVNSEYPAVMAAGTFPASYLGGWVTEYTGKPGIYTVRFWQPADRGRLPLLHVKNDRGGFDYVFEGTGTYTQPELDLLVELGGRFEVIEGYVYYETEPIFKDFIDYWYGVRLTAQAEGNDGLSYICKILMNSLYGKFGQKEEGWSIQFWDADKMAEEVAAGTEFIEHGDIVVVRENKANETTFVGIAAFVTGYARALLFRYFMTAQDLGCTVVYCDTDSLHVIDGESLPVGSGLGALKLEYVGSASYAGKKLYRLHDIDKVKAKGIGRRAAQMLTREDFKRVLAGGSILIPFTAFPTPLEVLSGQRPPAVMLDRARTIRVTANPQYRGVQNGQLRQHATGD